MPTQNLVGNANLSSFTLAAGDILNINAFILTVDASPAASFTLAFNNILSRAVVSGTQVINVAIAISAAVSSPAIVVAAAQSLSLNNCTATVSAAQTQPLFSITGGVLAVSAGSSATTFIAALASNTFILVTQAGGTFAFTGTISTFGGNPTKLIVGTGGSMAYNGDYIATGIQPFIQQTVSHAFTVTGNATASGSIASAFCNCAGSSGSFILNGTISTSAALATGILCNNTGQTVTINGSVFSSNGAVAVSTISGLVSWVSQIFTVGIGQECLISSGGGAINISGLVVKNSGKFAAVRNGSTGLITIDGTTALNNMTSSAHGAVLGAAVPVSNQPSTVSYMPIAGQVQNGVVFGFVGSTVTGTAATIDINALSSSLATAVTTTLGTGSQFTSLAQASAIFPNVLRTQLTEAYAANGVAPTLEQAIFLIQQSLHEFSITGPIRRVNKIDGITQAAAFTLNNSTAPTATTRSA